MSEERDIVERLKTAFDSDHDHDCDGRTYVCSCDFDETVMVVIEDSASEIQRLRGEVERLSSIATREGWRDIESAPRDGSPILLAGGSDDVSEYADEKYQALVTAPCRAMWTGRDWLIALAEAGYVSVCRENPTHWMPLPAPPAP